MLGAARSFPSLLCVRMIRALVRSAVVLPAALLVLILFALVIAIEAKLLTAVSTQSVHKMHVMSVLPPHAFVRVIGGG